MKKRYDLSSIMKAAWMFFRKGVQSFAVALRMAWANAKTHNAAKAAAGVGEESHTWAGGAILVMRASTKARHCTGQSLTIPQPRAEPA